MVPSLYESTAAKTLSPQWDMMGLGWNGFKAAITKAEECLSLFKAPKVINTKKIAFRQDEREIFY